MIRAEPVRLAEPRWRAHLSKHFFIRRWELCGRTCVLVVRHDNRHEFRFRGFPGHEIVPSVYSQKCGYVVRRPVRNHLQRPPTQHSGETQRRQSMAYVMLAVTKRTLAILPRFAPDNRR